MKGAERYESPHRAEKQNNACEYCIVYTAHCLLFLKTAYEACSMYNAKMFGLHMVTSKRTMINYYVAPMKGKTNIKT